MPKPNNSVQPWLGTALRFYYRYGHGRRWRVRLITPLKTVFGVDLRSLAAFRVMLAVYILVDLANRWPFLSTFYTDAGVLSRTEAIAYNNPARWSLFYLNGDPWTAHVLFILLTLGALALLVGFRTRAATFLCWVLTVSVTNRNLLVIQGDDNLICLLLFWGLFLPLGARFAVDDALRASHDVATHKPAQRAHDFFSPATVALVLQVSYVYVFGAFLKKGSEWRETFDAVYYALSAESVSTPLGELLLTFDWLLSPMTVFVYWLELLMPLYIFTPVFFTLFRTVGLAMLIAMHLGFALFLSVGLFPLASIASLTALIPPAVWAWFSAREPKGHWTLFYDSGCMFCRKTCLLLRSFSLPYHSGIEPAQNDAVAGPVLEREASWVVRTPHGDLLTRWTAVVAVLKNSPLTWPLGFVAGLLPQSAGDGIYQRIGDSRGGLGRLSEAFLRFRPLGQMLSWPIHGFVIALTVFVFVWNVDRDPASGLELPKSADYAAKLLRLDQRWGMFAPVPIKAEGWYGFEGTLKNGLHVDLWTREAGYPPAQDPENLRAWYQDYRWRKYLRRLYSKPHRRQRRNLANYWCRQRWADAKGIEQPLVGVKMMYYSRWTQLDRQPDTYRKTMIFDGKCN